jgi:hypothetical protein
MTLHRRAILKWGGAATLASVAGARRPRPAAPPGGDQAPVSGHNRRE